MGENKKWGEGLAATLTALPIEVKFVIGLVLALSTIIPAGLATAGIFSVLHSQASDRLVVWCAPQETDNGQEALTVEVSLDDPRIDESDINATRFRLCATGDPR